MKILLIILFLVVPTFAQTDRTICGTVTGYNTATATFDPAPNVRMDLHNTQGALVQTTLTGAFDGVFCFRGVPTGYAFQITPRNPVGTWTPTYRFVASQTTVDNNFDFQFTR